MELNWNIDQSPNKEWVSLIGNVYEHIETLFLIKYENIKGIMLYSLYDPHDYKNFLLACYSLDDTLKWADKYISNYRKVTVPEQRSYSAMKQIIEKAKHA